MAAQDTATLLHQLTSSGAIPPFVYCYPPRSSYRALDPAWTLERIWEADETVSLTRDLNVYVHVPFCRYKCGFCNLYTVTSTDGDVYDAYVDALCAELRRHAPIIQRRNLRTVYIGGGTPSLLTLQHFAQLFETLGEIYPNWRPAVEEVCLEATPDSIVDAPEKVRALLDMGLTRINMGVQSLEAVELKEAGRQRAGRDVIRQATAIAKEQGLPNLSTDLIMGFAGQSDESWLRSVRALVDLDPETISTYFLTVRPDAWFSKTGKYGYQRSPELYRRSDLAREIIWDAGYVQESNVRYKRPGRGGYRQKVLQFHGVPVLGIGVGARTYTNTVDYAFGGSHEPSLAQVWAYVREARSGGVAITGGFVYDDAERLRKRFALDLFDLDLRELQPYDVWAHEEVYADVLAACVELGFAVEVGDTRYQLTPAGYKYRDVISWMFFSDLVGERDREFYGNLHALNSRALATMGTDAEASGLRVPQASGATSNP